MYIEIYHSCVTFPLCVTLLPISFQDILQNESIKLDWDFRISLVTDIVKVKSQVKIKFEPNKI